MAKKANPKVNAKVAKKVPERLSKRYLEEKETEADRILAAYTAFQEGRMSRNDYFWVIWKALENLINDLIKKYNRLLNSEYNDLIVEAQKVVLEHLPDYDPERGTMPSTFFLRFINDAHREMCRGDITVYYLGAITRLNRAAQHAGFEGIDDPNLTETQLAMLSNESISTVRAARENFHASQKSSLADVEENVEDIYHDTPEKIVLGEEKKETAIKAFNSLSPLEQMLVYEIRVNKTSAKKICQFLTDRYEEYGLNKRPSQDDILRRFNAAMRKLTSNRYVKKYINEVEDVDDDDFELISQLSEDGIDEAVGSGLLDEI